MLVFVPKEVRQRRSRRNEVSVRSGQVEFVKVNTDAWKWRDIYRWLLGLSWPQFALFVGAVYIGLNLFFAVLYSIEDRKSTRLNSSHRCISYAVFCLKKQKLQMSRYRLSL